MSPLTHRNIHIHMPCVVSLCLWLQLVIECEATTTVEWEERRKNRAIKNGEGNKNKEKKKNFVYLFIHIRSKSLKSFNGSPHSVLWLSYIVASRWYFYFLSSAPRIKHFFLRFCPHCLNFSDSKWNKKNVIIRWTHGDDLIFIII
jgi:hypothetical protein